MAEAESTPQVQAVAAPSPGRAIAVDTPVARPVPQRQVVTRRLFILGGFWSAFSLAMLGLLGGPLDFIWPRSLGGFGGPINVTPDRIPAEGGDPIRIIEGKFWLLNLKAGPTLSGVDTPGGLLALYQKCPHLGCTVPWRPDFTFQSHKGWFRCPCHGSTYTRDGGVKVAGPAPRPMDVFPLEIGSDLGIVVQTGRQFEGTGSAENPARATPYQAGNTTPEV